jgi:aerobic-type carbon monoxide dehydrogenase small subunit (CoxS/CutS family)
MKETDEPALASQDQAPPSRWRINLHRIELTVNGQPHELTIEPNRRLIDVLREDLALTGTKEGCSIGVCGACTVLLDGMTVSACLTLAIAVQGRSITTIEGLDRNGELHPVQQAFIEHSAIQCGFCTPGQIMAASALLAETPCPSEDEIRDQMMGNLCRCSGYYSIMQAIRTAARKIGGAA